MAVGIRCVDHVTPLYPQKLALTSPTGGGRSVGIVRSRTKATEFSLVLGLKTSYQVRRLYRLLVPFLSVAVCCLLHSKHKMWQRTVRYVPVRSTNWFMSFAVCKVALWPSRSQSATLLDCTHPEHGGSKLLRKIGNILPFNMTSRTRTLESLQLSLFVTVTLWVTKRCSSLMSGYHLDRFLFSKYSYNQTIQTTC